MLYYDVEVTTMRYSEEQLKYVLAYLGTKPAKRVEFTSPKKVDLDLDCGEGTLTGYSNKAWAWQSSGISFHYSYGGGHSPGSVCAHNICMCPNREGKFYHDGYFHDTPANQQKLRDMFIEISSEMYQVSIAEMLEEGKTILDAENKKLAWRRYCIYLGKWAEENKASEGFPKPLTFAAWYKKNK